MLPWIIVAILATACAFLAFGWRIAYLSLVDGRAASIEMVTSAMGREAKLDRELKDANNRLFAAWEGGKVIPPSDIPLVDPVAETPLVPELQSFLDQYQELTVRAKYERIIRQGLAKQMSPLLILKQFETPEV